MDIKILPDLYDLCQNNIFDTEYIISHIIKDEDLSSSLITFIYLCKNNHSLYDQSNIHILEYLVDDVYKYIYTLYNGISYIPNNKDPSIITIINKKTLINEFKDLVDSLCLSNINNMYSGLAIISRNTNILNKKFSNLLDDEMVNNKKIIIWSLWKEGIIYLYNINKITIDEIAQLFIYHLDHKNTNIKHRDDYECSCFNKYSVKTRNDRINRLKDIIIHIGIEKFNHNQRLCNIFDISYQPVDIFTKLTSEQIAHLLGYNIYNSIPNLNYMASRINKYKKIGRNKFFDDLHDSYKLSLDKKIENYKLILANEENTLGEKVWNYHEFDKLYVYSYTGIKKYLYIFTIEELKNMFDKDDYRNYYTNEKLSYNYQSKIESIIDIHNHYKLNSGYCKLLYLDESEPIDDYIDIKPSLYGIANIYRNYTNFFIQFSNILSQLI